MVQANNASFDIALHAVFLQLMKLQNNNHFAKTDFSDLFIAIYWCYLPMLLSKICPD